MSAGDPHNLQRFVDAQAPVYEQVRRELRDGRKRTHWMWFVFPQIAGLGRSAMAHEYAIGSLDEAKAYLEHETLGPRLLECTRLVVGVADRPVTQIFAAPDDLKFHSSMTLFAHAAPNYTLFRDAIRKYFGGRTDTATLAILRGGAANQG